METRYCQFCGQLLANCTCFADVESFEENEENVGQWFKRHEARMLQEGKYQDPCKGCGGEDCVCCEFHLGY